MWALGIILYEMCFKISPFLGNQEGQTIANITDYLIQYPASHNYNNNLIELINSLLDPEPSSRITIQ